MCTYIAMPHLKWHYSLNTYIVLKRDKDWKYNYFICLVRVCLGCLVCPLSCPLSTRQNDIKGDSIWKKIVDLVLKPTFILIGIGTFLINMAYFVPLFYIPDMAVFMGVERTKANFLLSIFGKLTATLYLLLHLTCDFFMFTYQQLQILLANLAVAGYRTEVVSVLCWCSIPIFSWVESPHFLCHFAILMNCMLLSFLRMDFSQVFVPLKPLFL